MTEIYVSRCGFFIRGGYTKDDGCVYIKNACEINGTECCLVPECYYKQLKRLEAENREFKACLEDFNKPEVKKVLVYYGTGELDRLEDKCEALEQENAKLKSTIELIKEYALDMEVWSYIRKDLLDIIGGAEDER